VGYTPGTPYADKTHDEWDVTATPYIPGLYLDNIMRAFVRENLSTLVAENAFDLAEGLTRVNPFVAVEADRDLAPLGDKEAGFGELLPALAECARQSDEKGVPLFFRLERDGDATFTFRVWSVQPRIDRSVLSDRPVILSESGGNLTNVREVYDYSERRNVVYILGETEGQGDGADRLYYVEYDLNSIRRGPFGRREASLDLGDVDNEEWMRAEGKSFLRGHRPRLRLTADVVDAGKYVYGRDYAFGYRVSVVTGEVGDTHQFNAIVDAVRLTADDRGSEQIAIAFSHTEPV
jgi:hypothetical protein